MSTKKVKEAEAVSEEVTQQSKLAEAKRALSGVLIPDLMGLF